MYWFERKMKVLIFFSCCYYFLFLMVFYYYVEFSRLGISFFLLYCIGKVSLCIINFTVHSMFGKFEKLS